MISIGNDIVDLKHTDPQRTTQPKFYSKILSADEGQLYNPSFKIPFAHFVWLLWSVKESAYKCLQRQQPDLVFSPVKIEVSNIKVRAHLPLFPSSDIIEATGLNVDECFTATVSFNSQNIYARSVIYGDELIHTIVCREDRFENILWGIKQTDKTDQSAAVRAFLLGRLRNAFPDKNFRVEKSDDDIPLVIVDGETNAVSLSHHGQYIGYAIPVYSNISGLYNKKEKPY